MSNNVDTLQGFPLGLVFGSLPFILKTANPDIAMATMGLFKLASWPYSLKIFWSPIVDSFFFKSIGRRKSWIIPIQTAVGIWFYAYSDWTADMIYSGDVKPLAAIWFVVIFFIATQDIAVDGWALTILSKESSYLQGTTQSVGQNIGFFLSYTIFLVFNSTESSEWINSSLGGTYINPGDVFITLPGFLKFMGLAFLFVTMFVLMYPEKDEITDEEISLSSVYSQMKAIIQLPTVKTMLFVLMTNKIGFVLFDASFTFHLIDVGFPQTNLAMFALIGFPFELIFPVIIGMLYKRADYLLQPWIFGYWGRLVTVMIYHGVYIYILHFGVQYSSAWLYWMIPLQLIYQFASSCMYVTQCSMFTEVADPAVGGTYQTLLNTAANFGFSWMSFIVMQIVDHTKFDVGEEGSFLNTYANSGFNVLNTVCLIGGAIWVKEISQKGKSEWTVEIRHQKLD